VGLLAWLSRAWEVLGMLRVVTAVSIAIIILTTIGAAIAIVMKASAIRATMEAQERSIESLTKANEGLRKANADLLQKLKEKEL